jgi:hypothetical protein
MSEETDVNQQMTKLAKPERERTYIYPDGSALSFKDVVAVSARRASGNHRLETADGKKHIVLAGFRAITLDMDEWTF